MTLSLDYVRLVSRLRDEIELASPGQAKRMIKYLAVELKDVLEDYQ